MASKRQSGSKKTHGTTQENETVSYLVTYQNYVKKVIKGKDMVEVHKKAAQLNKPYSLVLIFKKL